MAETVASANHAFGAAPSLAPAVVAALEAMTKWSYQKGLVALELDTPRPDGASPFFDFDESGRTVYE